MRFFAAFLFVLFVFVGTASAQTTTKPAEECGPPSPEEAMYVYPKYDVERNPADDLKLAIQRATVEGKRILVEVGGDWCSWCHALDKFIKANTRVGTALATNFVVVKVNYSEENKNEAFLAGYPKPAGYPHIYVLEKDGKLLHSQNTGDLEKDKSYSEEAMMAFVDNWVPAGKSATH